MRILVTGASSPLAVGVLRQLLLHSDWELWCGRHRNDIPLADPRVHVVDLDLESDLSGTLSRAQFDMVVHFAGVTHASDEVQYWKINLPILIFVGSVSHSRKVNDNVKMPT